MTKKGKINTDPINWMKYISFFMKYKFYIVFIVAAITIFGISRFYTEHIFTNDYILNDFIDQKQYSRKCLALTEEKGLSDKLYTFYKKHEQDKDLLPIFFVNFPSQFPEIKDVKRKKYIFLKMILPSVVKYYNDILQEREQLLAIKEKFNSVELSDEDLVTLRLFAKKYKVKAPSDEYWVYASVLDELLLRVDVVPISIVLGMAAKETGWGTGRFFLEGNALFSQWVWSENLGMKAKNSNNYVRKFDSINDAVAAYFTNINTHSVYKNFRKARATYSKKNHSAYVHKLVENLSFYSEERAAYTTLLSGIIRNNNLEQYDVGFHFNKKYKDLCLEVI